MQGGKLLVKVLEEMMAGTVGLLYLAPEVIIYSFAIRLFLPPRLISRMHREHL